MRLPELPDEDLVAFDPGHSTGVVEIRRGGPWRRQTLNRNELIAKILAGTWKNYNTWVIEAFLLYPWKASGMAFDDLVPVRIIGMLELAAAYQSANIVFQTAGNAKNWATDKRLFEYNWLSVLHNKHERDAARHALYYLLNGPRRRKK